MMKKLSHATPCSNIIALKPAPERFESDDALLPLPVSASVHDSLFALPKK
jgi:hypothetical protein